MIYIKKEDILIKNNRIIISNDLVEEVKYQNIGVFNVDDKDYIALMELDTQDILWMHYYDNNGDISIEPIESDKEFKKVSECFELIIEVSHL